MTGEALFIAFPGQPAECLNIEWHAKTGGISIWERGPSSREPFRVSACAARTLNRRRLTMGPSVSLV